MYNFRDLRIWRNARAFVSKIYLETKAFPPEEKHGLALQMRRAAVSIPSNIAEGCGREGDKTIQQFLGYSLSSAFELETQLLISGDLQFIHPEKAKELIRELQGIQKGIHYFRRNLK